MGRELSSLLSILDELEEKRYRHPLRNRIIFRLLALAPRRSWVWLISLLSVSEEWYK
jgi:hypothetical protein